MLGAELTCKDYVISDTRKKMLTTMQNRGFIATNRFKAFPVPNKSFPSLDKVEKRIDNFFNKDYLPKGRDAQNPRLNLLDFAYWMGYKSRPELLKAAYDKTAPEYSRLLIAGIDRLNMQLETRLQAVAYAQEDTKTMLALVERNDRMMDKYNPELKDDKSNLNVTINIAREERIQAVMEESMSKLAEHIALAKKDALPAEEMPSLLDEAGVFDNGDKL